MPELFLAGYRSPTVMVIALLGFLVFFGGLLVQSEVLAIVGVVVIVLGGRLVDFVAQEERAGLREWWGKLLDDLSEGVCLVLDLVALIVVSVGLWQHRLVGVIIGIIIGGAGHYYVRRRRRKDIEVDSSPGSAEETGGGI